MIDAESFYNEERDVWAGAVVGRPETNASGETRDQMTQYMVVAWNRDNPSAKVARPDQFRFTELAARPDWA